MRALLLVLLAGTVAALEVGPVHLPGSSKYITYLPDGGGHLICDHSLDGGQEVSSVLWEILKDGAAAGSFEWKPNAPPTVSGLLENMVNLTRDDSDLELTTLTYALGANYTCTVTATDGSVGSATEEILVIDTTSNHIYMSEYENEGDCIVSLSGSYYPVFPEPTVDGGLYVQSSMQYIERIDTWTAVHHENGSVGYSFSEKVFHIDANTPDDVVLRTEIGVTKTDGEYLPFSTGTSFLGFRHSCEYLEAGENQKVSDNSDDQTCFGQPLATFASLKATVECADGYVSSGQETSVTMYCDRDEENRYQWVPAVDGGLLPEDLHCVPMNLQ